MLSEYEYIKGDAVAHSRVSVDCTGNRKQIWLVQPSSGQPRFLRNMRESLINYNVM